MTLVWASSPTHLSSWIENKIVLMLTPSRHLTQSSHRRLCRRVLYVVVRPSGLRPQAAAYSTVARMDLSHGTGNSSSKNLVGNLLHPGFIVLPEVSCPSSALSSAMTCGCQVPVFSHAAGHPGSIIIPQRLPSSCSQESDILRSMIDDLCHW